MTIAIALILIGLALIIAEVIFIPGTTIIGFAGAAFGILGIVKIYIEVSSTAGHIALGLSLLAFGLLFFVILKYNVWAGMSLNDALTNKVNENSLDSLSIGDIGSTKSVLRPVGKAVFNHVEYEVQTLGHYVDAGVTIKIISITQLKITVETIES